MSYSAQKYRVIDAMLQPGSEADKLYREATAGFRRSKVRASAAVGRDDLFRQGGRVLAQAQFRNVFLGDASVWAPADPTWIDDAIRRALRDRRLENVMRQYFSGSSVSCEGQEFAFGEWDRQQEVERGDVEAILERLFRDNPSSAQDLDATLFNIVLPRGVVLRSGPSTSRRGLGAAPGARSR